MRTLALFVLFLNISSLFADNINRYMNIVRSIPLMEMKADEPSQSWARSARTILTLTSESIAESLILANQTASEAGKPFFCIPTSVNLNGETLNQMIQETYQEISSKASDKDGMTVSQIAMMGLQKHYPCQQPNQGLFSQNTATHKWVEAIK